MFQSDSMHYMRIKKGLDIPLRGASTENRGDAPKSETLALDLSPFEEIAFHLKVKEGDQVIIGQPLAEDKKLSGRMFVSPAAGKVAEVKRGLKRRLLSIVIAVDQEEKSLDFDTKKPLLDLMMESGFFSMIRRRPGNILASPKDKVGCIFVKGLYTAPFEPPPQIDQAQLHEGLKALSTICPNIHLIHGPGFPVTGQVSEQKFSGRHPASNASIHIATLDPIRTLDDIRWTMDVHDVMALGHLVTTGNICTKRHIALAGEGVPENLRGLYIGRRGQSISSILPSSEGRIISGDPLMGVLAGDHLGHSHRVVSVIPNPPEKRKFLHFMRPTAYTATRAYFSSNKEQSFTTSQHGEDRAFVDCDVYQKVMPLKIPVVPLLKALLAKDYERAVQYGLLEIAPEDFALTTFICPSKIDHVGIVHRALLDFTSQYC